MGHTRLQGRTRIERTLEASRRQEWASRIRTSGVPGGHPILDTTAEEEESDATKKGQENSTEENRIEAGLDRRENEGRVIQRQ